MVYEPDITDVDNDRSNLSRMPIATREAVGLAAATVRINIGRAKSPPGRGDTRPDGRLLEPRTANVPYAATAMVAR